MKLLISEQELSTQSAHAPIPLRCEYCGQTFYRPKYRVLTTLKGNSRNSLRYCSRSCNGAATKLSRLVTCANCGKQFEKHANQIKKSKNHFCSRACSMTYNNLHVFKSTVRSRAEDVLANLIRHDFPRLELKQNVKGFLSGALEIDILIPSKNLAIELNGPIHYFPIHGEEKLKTVQSLDIQKQIQLHTMGYSLIVVDISHLKTKKRTDQFLSEYYPTYIKPILEQSE